MRNFKPEIIFHFDPTLSRNEIENSFEKGLAITAKVVTNDLNTQKLCLKLGHNLFGTMDWEESSIYSLTNKYSGMTTVPDQVSAIMDRTVRVMVTAIDADGHITLSRKANQCKAWEELKNTYQSIFEASVVGVHKEGTGVFLDVGEGLISFCHLHQFTSTRVNLRDWVKYGDIYRVAIHDIDVQNKRISCSRKLSCTKDYDDYKKYDIVDVKIAMPIECDGKITGYNVEVAPNVRGIADVPYIPRKFEQGESVQACIKKIWDRKMKLAIL